MSSNYMPGSMNGSGIDSIEFTINWDCVCGFYNEIDVRTNDYGDYFAKCEKCPHTKEGNAHEE